MNHTIGPLIDQWFDARFYAEATSKGHRTKYADGRPISFNEAQGLFMWCPCGYHALGPDNKELFPLDLSLNHGRPHGLLVPFADRGLPPDHGPVGRDNVTHPRWKIVSGADIFDLTLSPSIAVGPADNECWHGFITNGQVC